MPRCITALFALWLLTTPLCPAFQYATSRAIVSRARSDQRTLATALEAYHGDHSIYPASTGPPHWQIADHALTTPFAYLTEEPPDSFKSIRVVPYVHQAVPILCGFLMIWAIVTILPIIVLVLLRTVMRLLRQSPYERDPFPVVNYLIITFGLSVIFTLTNPHLRHPPPHRTVRNRDWQDQPQGFFYATDGRDTWALQSLGPDGTRTLQDLSPAIGPEPFENREESLRPFSHDPTNGVSSEGDVFRISQ